MSEKYHLQFYTDQFLSSSIEEKTKEGVTFPRPVLANEYTRDFQTGMKRNCSRFFASSASLTKFMYLEIFSASLRSWCNGQNTNIATDKVKIKNEFKKNIRVLNFRADFSISCDFPPLFDFVTLIDKIFMSQRFKWNIAIEGIRTFKTSAMPQSQRR